MAITYCRRHIRIMGRRSREVHGSQVAFNGSSGRKAAAPVTQHAHDGLYRVRVPCRYGHAKQLVEPTEMADGPHVTTVFTEDEAICACHHPHQPFVPLRELDRKWRVVPTSP